MMRKIIGYPSATINRQKVSSTSNGLENNDLNSRLSPPITFQLYSPYSSIGITLIIMHKPIDQCARMRLVVVMKWKEEKNLPNFHSFHTWLWIIQNNESCIMLWITMETQSWPYSLTAHTPHSTQVAGCIECGNGRMVDHDLAVKLRAPTDCSGWEVIWMIESVEILVKGKGELWLWDECNKHLEVPQIAIFYMNSVLYCPPGSPYGLCTDCSDCSESE